MYSFVSRSFVAALSVGLLVFLSAFYSSDKYMMGGGKQLFGDHFRAAEIDTNGNVLKQEDGTPSYIDFKGFSVWYKAELGTKLLYFKIDEWNSDTKIYNFQLEVEDKTTNPPFHKFYFGLLTIEHNIANLFLPSESDQELIPLLRSRGIKYDTSGNDAKFTDRSQLLDALGVFTDRMQMGQKLRFMIATTGADMDRIAISTATARDISKTFAGGKVSVASSNNDQGSDPSGAAFDERFSKGLLMKAVYDGTATSEVIGQQPTYWYSFINGIYTDKDCSYLTDDKMDEQEFSV